MKSICRAMKKQIKSQTLKQPILMTATPMTVKQQLQRLNNQLDKARHRLAAAQKNDNKIDAIRINKEMATITKQLSELKGQQTQQISSKGEKLKRLSFNRVLSKVEQADMGKLKKRVKGLVVVHPLTALGREMAITEVTGFAPAKF